MGTSRVYRPYRGKPRSVRALGIVKINITTESVITGEVHSFVLAFLY